MKLVTYHFLIVFCVYGELSLDKIKIFEVLSEKSTSMELP